MSPRRSKSALLYDQVRHALQSGRYPPGQRIDPAALADECDTSPTPVRFALYRLVGEGLIADHAREGLHVPVATETELRDLYDWMERLLLMACDIGVAKGNEPRPLDPPRPHSDVVKLTWKLFDAIAASTAHISLYRSVRQTNDRLAPVRRAKHHVLDDTFDELTALQAHWQQHDTPALKSALVDYHERRKRLVPRIVAMLGGTPPHARP